MHYSETIKLLNKFIENILTRTSVFMICQARWHVLQCACLCLYLRSVHNADEKRSSRSDWPSNTKLR
jgi:hypothetical protein